MASFWVNSSLTLTNWLYNLKTMMKAILFLLLLATSAHALDLTQLIAQLKEEEGFRPTPYLDTRGFWTIGYGHRCNQNAPAVNKDSAETTLILDIHKAQKEVVQFSDNEDVQFILVDMAFQMGNGVAAFKKMLSCIKKNDYKGAADNMLHSDWHKQTPKRCEKLAKMMSEIKP